MLRNHPLSPCPFSTGNKALGTAATAKDDVASAVGAMLARNPEVRASKGVRCSGLAPFIETDVPVPSELTPEIALPLVDGPAEFRLPPAGVPLPPEPSPAPPLGPRVPPPLPAPLKLPPTLTLFAPIPALAIAPAAPTSTPSAPPMPLGPTLPPTEAPLLPVLVPPPALTPFDPTPALAEAPTAPVFAPPPTPLGPKLPLAEAPMPPLLRPAPALSPPDPTPALAPAPRPTAPPLTPTSSAAPSRTCATVKTKKNRAARKDCIVGTRWVRSPARLPATVMLLQI
jgi:hypothetical protein